MSDIHLEDILRECAELRGVGRMQHRTLHEFDWFISACIWGRDSESEEERTVYEKFKDRIDFANRKDALLEWGKLFLEYCEEEYEDTEAKR